MKKTTLLLLGALSAPMLSTSAELPTPDGPPRLEFRTIPLESLTKDERSVKPYRLYDKMVVTVWDPIACGQKPVDPKFSIDGDTLSVSYLLTPALSAAKRCTLVSEFDVINAPHRNLKVRFAGGAEPYAVAALKKCPFYTPMSNDIWECLAPATP
jgi:hypothetical protein